MYQKTSKDNGINYVFSSKNDGIFEPRERIVKILVKAGDTLKSTSSDFSLGKLLKKVIIL
jgi:hypothetical protein